jgi:ankyrin repeat protein
LKANPDLARSARAAVEAGRLGWKEGLELLARAGADLNASFRGYRPLHSLIQESPHGERAAPTAERVRCLRWLLSHGADPETLGARPPARAILIAAFVGERAFVKELLEGGAQVDGFVAAALGDIEHLEKELEREPEFPRKRDSGGLTALQCCAASGLGKNDPQTAQRLLKSAQLLIDRGADVNARTRGWDHDLDVSYFAISARNLDFFSLLLDRGADPTAALPSAAWCRDRRFAELALRHGAAPDLATDGEKPLLNQLVRWGQVEPALWLLSQGASPNLPDERGWTAVHQAASRGNERMLRAILNCGGDKKRKDQEGRTPRDIARTMRKPRMAALL